MRRFTPGSHSSSGTPWSGHAAESWYMSARRRTVGSDVVSRPPSPAVMILLIWKLNAPASPMLPSADPRNDPPAAWHTSSSTRTPCSSGDIDQHVHARGRTTHVDGNDRLRMARDPAPHVHGIQRERVVDLRDHRDRAEGEHGACGRNPGVARDDHLVARADAEPDQAAHEGARTRIDRYGVLRARAIREGPLELTYSRLPHGVSRHAVGRKEVLRANQLADSFDGRLLFPLVQTKRTRQHRRNGPFHPRRPVEPARLPAGNSQRLAKGAPVEHRHWRKKAIATAGADPGAPRSVTPSE